MKLVGLWILGIVLLPIIIGLILFGMYGMGELTPSIAITVPIALLLRDLKQHFQGSSDKTFSTIVARFFLMPFILFAWLSPFVDFHAFWKAFLFDPGGTTYISFFGISIPGVKAGGMFYGLAGVSGIAFAFWLISDTALLMRRRIRIMDATATTPLGQARAGRGEFSGTARAIEDESNRQTKASSKDAEGIVWENSIQPILLHRATRGTRRAVDTVLNRFYIEDGNGTIMVDPREATFFNPKDPLPAAREAPNIILLSGHISEEEMESGTKRTTAALLPGDQVYLFGIARPDTKDRLVVRPAKVLQQSGLLNRFLFNLDVQIASLDPRNMFILADGNEEQVKTLLRNKIRHVALFSLIWFVPATILLAMLLAHVSK